MASTSTKKDKARLEAEILRVFRDVLRPPMEGLVANESLDREARNALRAFGERPWHELTNIEELSRHETALGFFPAPVFRYYFPAFLRAVVRPRFGPRRSINDIGPPIDTVITATEPDWREDSESTRRFNECFGGYSATQRSVIRQVLEFLRKAGHRDAARNLNGYWSHS